VRIAPLRPRSAAFAAVVAGHGLVLLALATAGPSPAPDSGVRHREAEPVPARLLPLPAAPTSDARPSVFDMANTSRRRPPGLARPADGAGTRAAADPAPAAQVDPVVRLPLADDRSPAARVAPAAAPAGAEAAATLAAADVPSPPALVEAPAPAADTAAASSPAAVAAPAAPAASRRTHADHAGCTPAAHPPLLRERGIEGLVRLRVQVGADGRAREVHLRASSGWRLFDEAALAQARSCRFKPALDDGVPVDSWVEFPVRFALAG